MRIGVSCRATIVPVKAWSGQSENVCAKLAMESKETMQVEGGSAQGRGVQRNVSNPSNSRCYWFARKCGGEEVVSSEGTGHFAETSRRRTLGGCLSRPYPRRTLRITPRDRRGWSLHERLFYKFRGHPTASYSSLGYRLFLFARTRGTGNLSANRPRSQSSGLAYLGTAIGNAETSVQRYRTSDRADVDVESAQSDLSQLISQVANAGLSPCNLGEMRGDL